jgi:hypothetical protein
VELPREMSLAACAAAVRTAAQSTSPAAFGQFQPMPSPADLTGNVLGVCSGPNGVRHLILPDDIQPGTSILAEP